MGRFEAPVVVGGMKGASATTKAPPTERAREWIRKGDSEVPLMHTYGVIHTGGADTARTHEQKRSSLTFSSRQTSETSSGWPRQCFLVRSP